MNPLNNHDQNKDLRAKLLDHFINSMPVEVDRHYAEVLLDRVLANREREAYKKGYINGSINELENHINAKIQNNSSKGEDA